jgi:hypothetical protein
MQSMAAAACVGLLVLMAVLFLVVPRDERVDKPYNPPLKEIRNLVGQDFSQAWPPLIEKPLASELKGLTNDTESAVRFLVACVTVDIADTKSKSVN